MTRTVACNKASRTASDYLCELCACVGGLVECHVVGKWLVGGGGGGGGGGGVGGL